MMLLPPGFVRRHAEATGDSGSTAFVAREDRVAELVAAGLDDPETWQALLTAPTSGAGRGATAIVALPANASGAEKATISRHFAVSKAN